MQTNVIPFVSKNERNEPFTFRPPISTTNPFLRPYDSEKASPEFNGV
jgi:hypothetical protein